MMQVIKVYTLHACLMTEYEKVIASKSTYANKSKETKMHEKIAELIY